MEKTGCKCYFYTEGIERTWAVFKKRSGDFRGFQVPSFDELIALGESDGPFTCRGAETPEEKVLIMHSSGSTGMPKPILLDNIWVTSVICQKYLAPPPGRTNRAEGWLGPSTYRKPLVTSAPMYHGMYTLLFLRSIFTGPLVHTPSGVPLSAKIVMEVLETKLATCAMFPPSIIADLTATERGIKALSTLDDVFYGGAPLSREAGERVNRVTRLSSILGSVETCCIPALAPLDETDWDYYEFHPRSGAVFENVGEGLAELVIRPAGDLRYQPVFSGFPGIHEWRTNDLFEEHPAKPGLWRFKCRRDDVLVLSSGIKYDPIMFEKSVENHPLVKGALVVGHGRFQLGLILEPDWDQLPDNRAMDRKALLEQLWSAVEAANVPNAKNTRIVKSMIAFASREKPFARTAKHSIARRATLDLYADEIDELYSPDRFDDELSEQLGPLGQNPDAAQLRVFIRRALGFLLQREVPEDEHSDDDIIFDLGVDSVSVVVLVKGLRQALDDASVVTFADIYANPTISMLATAILNKLSSNGERRMDEPAETQFIEELAATYTANLPASPSRASLPPPPARHTVILTGSTGSLDLEDLFIVCGPRVARFTFSTT
ncbi:AMP-dependent synthetase/ligase [Macrophomina phaseolina MS6]|uniref:AMP-dependent synthetase/ligase n=1 Tax=Macrophomina phaseolina (strain MS6) TaxID=1126212 RepID=K2R805_MACPH|nr:AMP-dependent synthetase/ligase [Macrophomina phaseolina MS6]